MNLKEIKCDIPGVKIFHVDKHTDNRGWLIELFRHDELSSDNFPAMSYVSSTKPGTTRGPHEHNTQSDFFCFIGYSSFKLYMWDNREKSASFGRKFELIITEDMIISVAVPPGIVHAYKNIGDKDGLVFNAPDTLYAGEGKKSPVDEIRYENDPNSKFQID